jgi:hypothetical protein
MQSSSAFSIGIERVMAEASRTFRHHPLAVGLHPGFFEQVFQWHAGIHHVVHHAVGELAAIELGAAPFHAGIGRAFEEVDVIAAREAHQVLHGEDQRLVHQAVDHQPVLGRVHVCNAGMVTLETQPVRGNDAVKVMQRREVHRRHRIGRQPFHVAAHHLLLVFGRGAIGASINAVAQVLVPVLLFQDHILALCSARCATGQCSAAKRQSATQELPPACRQS